MNTNFKYRSIVVLALASILLRALSIQVFAADAAPTLTGQVPCAEVIGNAQAIAAGIEIPARRADYAALYRISECTVVSGVEYVLPVTGRSGSYDQDFLEMKDRKAELFDLGAYTARTTAEQGYQDPDTPDGYH